MTATVLRHRGEAHSENVAVCFRRNILPRFPAEKCHNGNTLPATLHPSTNPMIPVLDLISRRRVGQNILWIVHFQFPITKPGLHYIKDQTCRASATARDYFFSGRNKSQIYAMQWVALLYNCEASSQSGLWLAEQVHCCDKLCWWLFIEQMGEF